MNEQDWLAEQFEGHRNRLRAVAYRMLGSSTEADDAVQDAWIRLIRTDSDDIENLGGWLTTVLARVCLNMLQARKSRREESLGLLPSDRIVSRATGTDPEQEALLADSVGLALLVVLDTLAPTERLAFVLHDMFAVPFDEIAPIVGRTPTAARQLASRARRRVQGTTMDSDHDRAHQRAVVDAFLAASRIGDFETLVALLAPDVVLRADRGVMRAVGARTEVRGVAAVAETFSGRAQAAQLALVDGAAGAVWAPGGTPRVVFRFTIVTGKIAGIEMIADSTHLRALDIVILDN
jgi:RNA polymerase sigma factor (sigma-70 family)